MKIIPQGRYLHVYLETPRECTVKPLLLGWRQRKKDVFIIVEDNLINRLVLGMSVTEVIERNVSRIANTDGLQPFQVKDIDKMMGLQHCLNANPMGLGKTVETVRYLAANNPKTALIVCPKIIRTQWKDQLERWGNLKAEIYDGQQNVAPGVWIINYDKLRNEKTLMKFKEFQWEFLILDEAHKIKSRGAQQTQAVKNIPAAHRVALTGTPILRYVDDLWSILNFLDPQYACNSYHTFVDYFCEQQQTPWGPKIVGMTKNPNKIALLNALLDFISVRNAVKVGAGKTRETVRLPMAKKQRELYRKEKQLLLDELPENCTIANGAVLTIRLMQTTSWPGLFEPGEHGPKFEWVLEMCKNNPTEKIVVFSVFERTATALKLFLEDNGIHASTITGKQKAETNEKSRSTFIEGDSQVLIGTIGAMGQGYDGLQEVSHTLIFVDRDWSPEILKQAEDRLNRMGQKKMVNIYYLECQGSFDQHVGRINFNKADDIRRALNDEDNSSI